MIGYSPNASLETLGFLQVTWIMARYQFLSTYIGNTRVPDTDILRQKGMVEVCPIPDLEIKKGGKKRPVVSRRNTS
jgi:hypothetical protein